jgi:hypothetical protein
MKNREPKPSVHLGEGPSVQYPNLEPIPRKTTNRLRIGPSTRWQGRAGGQGLMFTRGFTLGCTATGLQVDVVHVEGRWHRHGRPHPVDLEGESETLGARKRETIYSLGSRYLLQSQREPRVLTRLSTHLRHSFPERHGSNAMSEYIDKAFYSREPVTAKPAAW